MVPPLILQTMLGLRWLKRTVFLNRETRRYIGYGVGEILLVIVGILIALQIDNWNSERQDRATLDNYLPTIAGNMREDIHMLEELHAARSESILLAMNARAGLLSRTLLNVKELVYLAQTMRTAEEIAYFNANTSGFDALTNSGVLDELQGKDVELVLSCYYVGSARTGLLEQAYNARIMAALSLPVEVSSELVEIFALEDPTALLPGRLEELQEFYSQYYSGQYPRRLLETAIDAAPILREYESLGHYQPSFAYSYYGDGEFVPRQQYIDHDFVSHADGALQVTVKRGVPWAAFFLEVRDRSNTLGRPSSDFTRFDRIILEARGASGGERLLLHMKDKDDPDDGSQTNLEIVLSEQWDTYEFDLADFQNADLSKLYIVLGLLILDQTDPLSFAVRTVRFLEPDE